MTQNPSFNTKEKKLRGLCMSQAFFWLVKCMGPCTCVTYFIFFLFFIFFPSIFHILIHLNRLNTKQLELFFGFLWNFNFCNEIMALYIYIYIYIFIGECSFFIALHNYYFYIFFNHCVFYCLIIYHSIFFFSWNFITLD